MVLISASRLVCYLSYRDLVWSWGQAAGSLDRQEDMILQWEGAGEEVGVSPLTPMHLRPLYWAIPFGERPVGVSVSPVLSVSV